MKIPVKATAPPAQRTTSISTPALAFRSLPRQKSHPIPPATMPPPECPPPPTLPVACGEKNDLGSEGHLNDVVFKDRSYCGSAVPLGLPIFCFSSTANSM